MVILRRPRSPAVDVPELDDVVSVSPDDVVSTPEVEDEIAAPAPLDEVIAAPHDLVRVRRADVEVFAKSPEHTQTHAVIGGTGPARDKPVGSGRAVQPEPSDAVGGHQIDIRIRSICGDIQVRPHHRQRSFHRGGDRAEPDGANRVDVQRSAALHRQFDLRSLRGGLLCCAWPEDCPEIEHPFAAGAGGIQAYRDAVNAAGAGHSATRLPGVVLDEDLRSTRGQSSTPFEVEGSLKLTLLDEKFISRGSGRVVLDDRAGRLGRRERRGLRTGSLWRAECGGCRDE